MDDKGSKKATRRDIINECLLVMNEYVHNNDVDKSKVDAHMKKMKNIQCIYDIIRDEHTINNNIS